MRNLVLLTTTIILFLTGDMSAQRCDSLAAAFNGDWRPVTSAPRDGTIVEMLETYGVAPWYGLFKWTKETTLINDENGKPVKFTDSVARWNSVSNYGHGVMEDHCLFWRPYKGTGKYIDPTGGAQNTVAYQCAALKLLYDKKTDRCVARSVR